MKRVNPKKRFGQHFLNDPGIAARIAASLTHHGDTWNILEIGPGTGMLTRALVAEVVKEPQQHKELRFVEVDHRAADYLGEAFPEWKDRIIRGDFLYLDLHTVFDGQPFAVIGNFPYNISSQILFRMVEHRELIPELVGMFQREVAMRVVSESHSREYGILSVLVQAFYDVEYLFTVEPESFDPPPKVRSAVIRLRRNDRVQLPLPFTAFKKVVKTAFSTRRKTLRNSLKPLLTPDVEIDDSLLGLRAENLSPQEFIDLAAAIHRAG